MKRSRSVVLTTMLAAPAMTLAGCGDQPAASPTQWGDNTPAVEQGKGYPSLQACKDANDIEDAACDTAFAQAQADNDKFAPRFDQQQTCEEQYGAGNCVPRSSGGSNWFGPALTGFIVGQALNGGLFSRPAYGGRYDLDYDRRTGSYYGGYGGYLGRGRDSFGAPARYEAPARVQSRSSVISRGGFGGGGRGYG